MAAAGGGRKIRDYKGWGAEARAPLRRRGGGKVEGVEQTRRRKMGSRKGASFLLPVLLLTVGSVASLGECICRQPPVIFNFGDSNSDTGGLQAGLGFVIGLPNGRRFPNGPTGRFSDGRLVIDFLCQRLNTRYLSPYLEPLGSDFRMGANFAIAGSATLPRYLPFSLYIQVSQFLRFRARFLELVGKGSSNLINEEGFRTALYTFDIGQNDLSRMFRDGLSYSQVLEAIPSHLAEIRGAIKMIYERGGRRFWVHGTGPLGCLPQKIAMYKKEENDSDSSGCLASYNSASRIFNDGLTALCDELGRELQNTTIVYTDIYAIKYDLIANHAKYGFESPLMACCGYGGPPYNYNANITCGNAASQACADGSKYISWDGVHYSEAANAAVASKILSSNYSKPRVMLESFCLA